MTRIEKRASFAVCLAALLTLPWISMADDHGQNTSGNGSGTGSSDSRNGNPGQNGDGLDKRGQQTGNNPNAPAGPPAPVSGANNPNQEAQRTRVALAATDAGNAIGASGKADLRAQGDEQRLKVEMEANVPDGTMFTLLANNSPIGTITIQLGEGDFEFASENGQTLVGGLAPAVITSIEVTDAANSIVLQAQFGPLSTNNLPLPPVLAVRKDMTLAPSAAGNAVKAEGEAGLRSGGAQTQLKVEVEANVPDGTVWTVFANGTAKLGTITLQLMEGELHLDGTSLAQAGITDASSIASIQVNDAGGTQVLAGSF
jgi:hypothetical protein